MEPRNLRLPMSDFLHLVYSVFRVHPCCSNTSTSFLYHWLLFRCMGKPHGLIRSCGDGHLGCFHSLAIVNNATRNINVQIFVWVLIFSSLGYKPRSGIAGPWGNSMFNVFEELPSCFPQQLHHFPCPRATWEGPSYSTPWHLLFSVFLITAIPVGVKQCVLVVLISISLVTNDIKHHFICSLVSYRYIFLEKCLFKAFACFNIGLSFHCCIIRILSTFGVLSLLYEIYNLKIFSPIVCGIFLLSWWSFDAHKYLMLMKSNLPIFSFVTCDFGVIPKNLLPNAKL